MAILRSTSAGEVRPGASVRALPRLRTELLATIAFLAIAALVLAVASVALVFAREGEAHEVGWWVAFIVALDGCVFVAYGAWQVRRLVSQPLEAAIATAEAIASWQHFAILALLGFGAALGFWSGLLWQVARLVSLGPGPVAQLVPVLGDLGHRVDHQPHAFGPGKQHLVRNRQLLLLADSLHDR